LGLKSYVVVVDSSTHRIMILKLEYPKKRTEVKVYAHAATEVRLKSGKLWKWVICDHHDWSSFIFPKFLFDLSPYRPLTT